ncbi:MAG: type II toxin-antitoxin system VapC family toxin [Desulfobulbaceae bacterium]|nr:type II toxin-antitoxin system VapC family toxin [Desulfobulbaceae bacterium]
MKTPDALHLATAQFHGCTSLWTNDDRLCTVAPDFVCNVLQFTRYVPWDIAGSAVPGQGKERVSEVCDQVKDAIMPSVIDGNVLRHGNFSSFQHARRNQLPSKGRQ